MSDEDNFNIEPQEILDNASNYDIRDPDPHQESVSYRTLVSQDADEFKKYLKTQKINLRRKGDSTEDSYIGEILSATELGGDEKVTLEFIKILRDINLEVIEISDPEEGWRFLQIQPSDVSSVNSFETLAVSSVNLFSTNQIYQHYTGLRKAVPEILVQTMEFALVDLHATLVVYACDQNIDTEEFEENIMSSISAGSANKATIRLLKQLLEVTNINNYILREILNLYTSILDATLEDTHDEF